ncbi:MULTISPECIES: DUF4376 domain-containing protein [Xanthomonas]|uniref:DUF4376 domain-containing protein n=1 Tax=Xanthomonas TaxID=338 RepID=UPI001AD9F53B|nr:DUF4376 domain-containing protein [Xanthomonas phaseoli]MBO9766524.1 DUF4376 domain-containing protein [Xanthomonas phaseoli pv. dieffenbachiae]MBO9776131.1 DUF4376 domain-containing protein [Xanthomonas phaseoli pv. dieffenbachiae]MBO9778271.1 DUF4376 domain-containing protein [Xanthomonas phaseoli pv. dieffenbachiae]MBO9795341.1 DUF4376 domain-containing protein [Xanthomonas phaseoli pv. dieffenbachiae]MBO9801464.1 DUF4376 domain-containing protein [Xanthomonas phaseoli pv. dieffenbachiae
MSYRLTENWDRVIRIADGATIPRGHRWWDDFEDYCASGGVPEPFAPPESPESLRAELRAAATQRRWECETGGITIGGVQVGSTTEDQNRISTVLAAADLGTVDRVDFKANSGWVTLTLAEIRGIAAAISAHVQACFTAERAHHEAIDAIDSLEALQAYDVDLGWPA